MITQQQEIHVSPFPPPPLQYYQLPNITIGGYDFKLSSDGTPVPVKITLRQYAEAELDASAFTYTLNGTLTTSKLGLHGTDPEEHGHGKKYRILLTV